ncbi:MAG: hypothetical protein AB1705_14360 [Verrucomicrobiota bacterium]
MSEQPDDGSANAGGKVEADGALPDAAAQPPGAKPLTPEEQMALYEKELKENDWGHQPC